MYQTNADQAPLTFCDVAACFSEEEWKLLHHWQKDLYKNVMKEIYQALNSLGPLIANSVFSLKPKDKVSSPMEHSQSERRGNIPVESVFKKSRNEKQYLIDSQEVDLMENCDVFWTGSVPADSMSFKKTKIGNQYLKESQDTDQSFQLDVSLMGPGHITPITSMGIDETGETYLIDVEDFQRKDYSDNSAGEGTTKRKYKNGDFVKCEEENFPCKSFSKKAKMKLIPKSENNLTSRKQWWLENNEKQNKDNTPHAYDELNNPYNSPHVSTTKAQTSDGNADCESNVWNTEGLLTLESRKDASESYFTNHPMNSNQNLSFTETQSKHIESSHKKKHFKCSQCEKSFSQKGHLNRHQRTHTGERPYHCFECDKSFNYKHCLQRHQRTHSGERPFQCAICIKSFKFEEALLRHQLKHKSHRYNH